MGGFKTHHLSESWLRSLTAQSNRIAMDPRAAQDAAHAMTAPTNKYLHQKHADSAEARDVCVRKLVSLAARQGMGEIAARVCAPYLAKPLSCSGPVSTPLRPAPPVPKGDVFCPQQALYLSVLEYAQAKNIAGKQAREALRFLAALAHPFSTPQVRSQLCELQGEAPVLHLDGVSSTLDPGVDGVLALLNGLEERMPTCMELAYDVMALRRDPVALHGVIAALDTLPLGSRLLELVECVAAPQGRTVANSLAQMHDAERAGHPMRAAASRAWTIWQAVRDNLLSTEVVGLLALPLETRLRGYFDNPQRMQDDDEWCWATRALFALRDLGRIAQTIGPDLHPICYWTPDVLAISHYRALLTRCNGGKLSTSPATYKMLRFLMRMEGPARPVWTRTSEQSLSQPVGHGRCTCESQKVHVAACICRPGRQLLVRLDPDIEAIVHGEFVREVGPFLHSAADQISAGLQRIYKIDLAANNWRRMTALFDDWKTQACIDGKLQILGEYLVGHAMQDGPDPSCVLDLHGKLTLELQVSEYLRVFRELALREYARRHGLEPHDVAVIERAPGFVRRYYNAEIFERYLRASDLCASMSDEEVTALVDYQVRELSVLERIRAR